MRTKFNIEVFDTLLKKQRKISLPTDNLGIDFGEPDAKNILIKVCNPYCGPCARAHPKIEKLLDTLPNLKAKIIFTTPNDDNAVTIKPTRHLMAVAEKNNRELTRRALDDWYLTDKKDYDVFAAKYLLPARHSVNGGGNGELQKQGHKIQAMHQWCEATKITFTPTIFINGYQLPDAYDMEDLQYFLLE